MQVGLGPGHILLVIAGWACINVSPCSVVVVSDYWVHVYRRLVVWWSIVRHTRCSA